MHLRSPCGRGPATISRSSNYRYGTWPLPPRNLGDRFLFENDYGTVTESALFTVTE